MKRVLFISPAYFSYEKIIKEKLIEKGFIVDWFDDRPKMTIVGKGIFRLFPFVLKRKAKRYINKIIKTTKNIEYDYVFSILGQAFTAKSIDRLRKAQPKAKYILYMWDSIQTFPNTLKFCNKFDVCYTFDNLDAQQYNFKFLPLFIYSYEFNSKKEIYDACFIGTIKKGKYKMVSSIVSQLRENGKNVFCYMYLQSKIVYFFYKITDKEFRKTKINDFKYKKMPLEEVTKISNSSKYIIDCPMKNQNGLSMRTFECLGSGKKLITTNINIVNYDFYNEYNILVWSLYEKNHLFFDETYQKIDDQILKKYSIENWINKIFADE